MTPDHHDSSLSAVLVAEQLCTRLEEMWTRDASAQPGAHVLILLAGAPVANRRAVTGHLLRAEWELRARSGPPPVAADYLPQFADSADLLHELERAMAFNPDMIPGYRLVRELGRGGEGVVYLAEEFDPSGVPFRTVALKILRPDRGSFDADQLILENDIRIAALFNHAHVVKVYRVGRVNKRLYFTMQYYPGGSLSARIRERGPLPPREAAALCAQIADAVGYMHRLRQPVLHLDIKPGNVLLDEQGQAYVADFGLSRQAPVEADGWAACRGGTPSYVSPEQVYGRVSPQCDIYSIGATLYEMLTGRAPFHGSTLAETLRQVVECAPVPPQALNPEVDDEIARLCLKCLEKNPDDRYRTIITLVTDLRHYIETGQGPEPGTFLEWLKRAGARKVPFEHGDSWSRITLFWAVYTVVGHVAMFGLLRAGVPGWGYWTWFAVFYLLGWLPVWVKLWCPRRALDQTEWGVLVNWVGAIAADGLLLSLFCPILGTPDPDTVARVYPAWLVLHGLMWLTEARSYWGRLYPCGIGFLIVAGPLQLAASFAPLVYAVVNGAAMLWLSVGFRAQARRRNRGIG